MVRVVIPIRFKLSRNYKAILTCFYLVVSMLYSQSRSQLFKSPPGKNCY